ncbi:hypothetical protein ACFC1W_07985 [Microbacterium sp. NPDC056003]|uniref:protein kinase domain-containing protein n=1 Tax=Microbacterium sp. NPDC056003 TaxID=3345676 RepID=UPI0035D7628A
MANSTHPATDVALLDPNEYLRGNRRIVVDTSALLEGRDGYAGGVPQLIMNSADALAHNPLVIPRAVLNELTNQTSSRRSARDPALAERARLAKALVQDLVSDGLATTEFGGSTDFAADPEFSTIARVATELGWDVLFLSADITVKLEVRLLGKKAGAAHLAGVATAGGLVEVEDPSHLLKKGFTKRKALADRAGKSDEYERLSAALREWPDAFGLRERPNAPAPRKRAPSRRNQQPSEPFADSSELKPPDQVLSVSSFPGEGDDVEFKRPGAAGRLVLGERISRGKEGSVYAIEDEPHLVAKVFKRGKVTTHRRDKVELMVQHKVWLPGVCFPESMLSYDGEFVGFTMRRAQGAHVLNDTIFIPQELDRLHPGWTRRDLVDVCLSFLKRVKSLHDLNILIGDINPNNVMLGNQKDAWIIDIDSVQVEGYPCPVGWDEFTAPEILGGVQGLRSIEHENFAVAVLLFMIMMTGTFPYENSGSDDTVLNIQSGLFPYGFDGRSERELQPPQRWLYVWSHLSRELKRLFWNSFHRDGSHYRPTDRVTVDEWIRAFEGFKRNLAYPDVDPQSLEIFPIRRKAEGGARLLDCPKCGGEKLIAQYSVGDDLEKEFRTPSLCNGCLPKCAACGEPREPESLDEGVCWQCQKSDAELARRVRAEAERARREAERAEREAERARRDSLDPTRICERCGKPYITIGEIEWLNQRGIAIRPVHKRSDPTCLASASPTPPSSMTSPAPTPKPEAATATYPGSAPQVESLWQRIARWFKSS